MSARGGAGDNSRNSLGSHFGIHVFVSTIEHLMKFRIYVDVVRKGNRIRHASCMAVGSAATRAMSAHIYPDVGFHTKEMFPT